MANNNEEVKEKEEVEWNSLTLYRDKGQKKMIRREIGGWWTMERAKFLEFERWKSRWCYL